MSQFLKVKTAEEVLSIVSHISPLSSEVVALEDAFERAVALDVFAPEPVPHFARATMDGFAVRASSTFGASETLPALLETVGEVLMGKSSDVTVGQGKAVAVPTGAMLPEGADAVVIIEHTQTLGGGMIEVTHPVAPGDNVLGIGQDIPEGEKILARGARLRPQDLGILAAVGITEIAVFRRPKVALISTGDEIVPVSTRHVAPGKIREINSLTLAAEIESSGAEIGMRACISDRLDELIAACLEALNSHDMIILSGGSSVGARDYTTRILEHLPESQLLVHGVAIKPGKPVILGLCGDKIFWGLPGQPVSALITCREFVVPSLDMLQGRGLTGTEKKVAGSLRAVLGRRLPSVHGRTDYVPVTVSRRPDELPEAVPVFGKSGAIGILVRADGYVVVPEHVEGLDRGTEVAVYPF